MVNFELSKTRIFQAVKWERHLVFRLARPLKKLFFILSVFLFIIFLYGFLTDNFTKETQKFSFGFSIIFLTFGFINWLKESFLNSKLKKPRLEITIEQVIKNPEKYNLAEFLSFETAKAVWQAIRFAKKKSLSKISSETLLYFSLKEWPEANFIFSRVLLNLEEIKKELKKYLDGLESREFQEMLSEDSQKVILDAAKIVQKNGRQYIKPEDILISQSKIDPTLKKYLIDSNLKTEDIENLTLWLEDSKEKIEERKKFWEWKNLIKLGSLAKDWAAGYTVTLDRFSIDITKMMKSQGFREIFAHKKEVEVVERILASPQKNNVLIVGEKGSGRRAIIEALANRSALGESLPQVNYKRVVQLDLSSLISQIGDRQKIETILDNIFKEVMAAGNIILVIDEFHNYVGGQKEISQLGKIDISGLIGPYLEFPQFQIIGITTPEGLHRYIEQNSSLLTLFEKVEVPEVSEKETLLILEDRVLKLEDKYKISISYPALRDIISLCVKYLPAIPFPEKAMELLDEVTVYVSQAKEKIVLPKHVAKILSEKTQIPIGEIGVKEREILLNLENLIHQRIINQEEAVKEISTALRRARAEVAIRNKPMGCFLFLGPTGVGKTETSKALAEIYFGSPPTISSKEMVGGEKDKMIRLDMSEFQATGDIARLIGSIDQEGLLTTPVRENPFSLILLDEIEKAHPNILNLFLQVLDEGHLTDGLGRKVDFRNTIIICTSNAGAELIWKEIREKKKLEIIKESLLDYLFEKAIFRPEFINRFDGVIIFLPLTKQNFLDITELLLQKLKKNLQAKDIEFVITPKLKEKITELGYSEVFGARQLKRTIAEKIENPIAEAILKTEIRRGSKFEIDPENFKLKINP